MISFCISFCFFLLLIGLWIVIEVFNVCMEESDVRMCHEMSRLHADTVGSMQTQGFASGVSFVMVSLRVSQEVQVGFLLERIWRLERFPENRITSAWCLTCLSSQRHLRWGYSCPPKCSSRGFCFLCIESHGESMRSSYVPTQSILRFVELLTSGYEESRQHASFPCASSSSWCELMGHKTRSLCISSLSDRHICIRPHGICSHPHGV